MREFIISDMHLGHGNILLYCGRPWLRDEDWYETEGERPKWASPEIKKARTNEMNEAMVGEWNAVVSPEDTVKHLGDFYFDNGDGKDAAYWENRLNGKIIHIKGNHDRSKQIKGMLLSATMNVAKRDFFIRHKPIERASEMPSRCEAMLCGHVHEKWDHKWVDGVLVVNMSVDVRKFRPMGVDEVVGEVERLKRIGCTDNE